MQKMDDETRKLLTDSLHTHQSAAVLANAMRPDSRYPLTDAGHETNRKLIEERADAMIARLLDALA